MAIPDSQRYPRNLYLINNVCGLCKIVFSLIWKLLKSDNFYMISFFNEQTTLGEKPQLKGISSYQNYKDWYLIHTWSHTAFYEAFYIFAFFLFWQYINSINSFIVFASKFFRENYWKLSIFWEKHQHNLICLTQQLKI